MPADPVLYGARGRFQVRDDLGRFVTGGSGIEWQGLELLDRGFENFGVRMHMIAAETAEALAPVMEQYMKTHARWQDRTTDARKGLTAIAVHERDASLVYCGYSTNTPYGFFLENYTYRGVSYAIVAPTIERFGAEMNGNWRVLA